MNFFNSVIFMRLVVISSLAMSPSLQAKSNCDPACFKHNIQLQLADTRGFPVEGTSFWVTLTIIKNGPLVTIKIPTINFVTGPQTANDPFLPFVPGGYIFTSNGFLPCDLRPSDLVPFSIVAASNNGLSSVFSFNQPIDTLPQPPAGYIVQITNAGALQIQCAGTFGNVIPPGPQVLMPCSITYPVSSTDKLCKNLILSNAPTITTEFSSPDALNDGLRDSHVNDAFDGVAAWAWCDNSMISDKTNGTLNCMVAIGRTNKKGKLIVEDPIQLTDLPPETMAWDTAVAINRTNPQNIVVSYGVINQGAAPRSLLPYRAVSFDGGKTWPENGPMNIQPTGNPVSFFDNRGVSCDKFGNIWYSSSNRFDNLGNLIGQPYFAVSSDGGVTYELAYTVPLLPDFILGASGYDYPQFCFGGLGDGSGTYGLWFSIDYFQNEADIIPVLGFIPITGLGTFGAGETIELSSLRNTQYFPSMTASLDGRLWIESLAYFGTSYITPVITRFKSPGAIDLNYAGPWDLGMTNAAWVYEQSITNIISQPVRGFFSVSIQDNLYDENRQALYAAFTSQSPDYSQNMRIYFIISRDNGQTWSEPIDVSNTTFANRGFTSMALDTVTGNLLFGWYDGRADSSYESLNYVGAIIPAETLDELVAHIPLSNPIYSLPSAL